MCRPPVIPSLGLIVVLLLLPGCAVNPGRPARCASGIEPLTEPEFDEFANQLAADLTTVLEQRQYELPAVIASPRVDPGGVEDAAVAGTFAHRLADGLNDRMRGAAFFRKLSSAPPQLRSTLRFAPNEQDARRGRIELRILDQHTSEQQLAGNYTYESCRPARGPRTRRAPPDILQIDTPPSDFGKLALQRAPVYRPWTIVGPSGRVIFLDTTGWRRFWLHAQHTTRGNDGRLHVDLRIRARRYARDARLRLVFYDDHFAAVEVTPVIARRFLARRTEQVTFTSTDPRASHYICLFAGQ